MLTRLLTIMFAPDEPPPGGPPPEAGTADDPQPAPAAPVADASPPGDTDATPDAGDWTPPSREDYERLVEGNAKAQKEARELKRAQETAAREAAEKAGEYETLYGTERQRAERLVAAVTGSALDAAVVEVAANLHFSSPALAGRLLEREGIDVTFDEDTGKATVSAAARAELERRLNAILTENPGLKTDAGAPGHRQLPGAGTNGTPSGDGHAAMNAMLRGGKA